MADELIASLETPRRLAALYATSLLDSEVEPAFDRITQIASRLLHAPVSLISLIDDQRQFFKSCIGLADPNIRETPLSHSFCKHVVHSEAPLIVRDATIDPRVSDNPAVAEFDVVAYLGVPLRDSDGLVLGSLCVIDHQRRDWHPEDVSTLSDLATIVMDEIALRQEITLRRSTEHALQQANDQAVFLANSSTRLAAALEYREWIEQVIELTVPMLGDICMLELVQQGGLQRIATYHPDSTLAERLSNLSIASWADPVTQGGATVLLTAADLARSADPAWAMLAPGGLLLVPLLIRGTTAGVLVLGGRDRSYTAAEVPLAENFAGRAAVALDNVRLYQQAQEAIGIREQFLSIAAHELKTPLTSLRGYAELLYRRLKRQNDLDERNERAISTILEQSDRLTRLVQTLFDTSALVNGQLALDCEDCDVVALTRQIVTEIQPLLATHTVHVQTELAGLHVRCDSVRIEQVIRNLIQNAAKYSPPGTTISLTLEQHDQVGCFAVTDQGIGITADALPHIFDRFYRAPNALNSSQRGVGIGLYVVRELVQLHGGEVTVSSEVGRGSTFTVCLPVVAERVPVAML